MPNRFDDDTAVVPTGPGSFEARLDPAWSVVRGPNGGYLAAIILRALTAAVDDVGRAPRSLTIHYVAPPHDDAMVSIVTTIERQGRSLTTCTARLHQDDRLVGLAVGAFSAPREGPQVTDLMMPAAPGFDEIPRLVPDAQSPPIAHRWDTRFVVGRLPRSDEPISDEGVTGGWIRPEDPHALDAPLVAAITDGWIPAVFSRAEGVFVVPTVDLTIHFRCALPRPGAPAAEPAFVMFRTTTVADGFLEEDGEVWSSDGVLLAQSRQLALVMPLA